MDGKKEIDVLYKYRPLNQYSEEFFTKKLIYFPSPAEFNDPYDCKVVFPALKNSKDIIRFFSRHFDEAESFAKRAIFLNGMKAAINNRKNREEMIEPFIRPVKAVLDSWGVFCLCERCNDLLMWSHYSDGHRGYCLEFDKNILNSLGVCRKVDYRKTYPIVSDFRDSTRTVGHLCTFSKYEQWEYEQEWRVVVDPKDNLKSPGSRHYEIPEELLTGIIFGCEMPVEHREKISTWLKNWKRPINFYEAIKKDDEYGVDIMLIEGQRSVT